MSKPDWITYVPRCVYDAARRLEAACEGSGYPSPIGVAEYRSDFRPTLAGRMFWRQVWLFLMEEDCIPPDHIIEFVVVNDPALEHICSVTPKALN